ncbi:MAG TPA: histidine kinase [Candidatus Acidoferrum sp.]|nr:histidine kinase [Candidatus Acidoferrum sp.]
MIFTLISLGTFTFGALAFSILALTYGYERYRGRTKRGGVFPWFTLACALAFALNLISQGWVLNAVTGLLPPMLLHLVYEQHRVRARWLLAIFYVAGVAASLTPGDAFENAPALVLGAVGIAGLLLSRTELRSPDASSVRQRMWTRVLLLLAVACAAASVLQVAPWVNLLPDYLVLAFFAMTLFYRERLTFFDLFLKRGAFFAIGLMALTIFFAFRTTPPWLDAMLLAPLWLAAPWLYGRVSHAVDRLWLHRAYSRIEAEHRFIQATQGAVAEADLEARALAILREIFQTAVAIQGDAIVLAPRPDGIPFLSEEEGLRQSLGRTLAVLRENVRFREQEQELRLLAGRAELKALRAQINPHFLFNALNAIAGLIQTQPALAEDTVERLAEVFRYTLRKSGTEWVRLEEEMEFVAACLGVERARFGDRLSIEIAVPPDAAAVRVPAMCVQPLVENAIKHAAEGHRRIGVSAALREGRVTIHVTDNGPGFPPAFGLETSNGHGLRNVAERLSGYYGASARLTWENLPEGTRVSLELPCAS